MKKLIIATMIALTSPLAQASSFYISCSTADGKITNVSGHAWETVVSYYDWDLRKKIRVEVEDAHLEVTEKLQTIERKQSQSECTEPGQPGWATSEETYVMKGRLILPDNASDKLKEIVGTKDMIFLCKDEYSGEMYCPEK